MVVHVAASSAEGLVGYIGAADLALCIWAFALARCLAFASFLDSTSPARRLPTFSSLCIALLKLPLKELVLLLEELHFVHRWPPAVYPGYDRLPVFPS